MIGTRIITKDRVPLYTLLPLEAPLILFLDPSDSCCLACNFCPTGSKELMKEVGRPLQQMDFDLYKKTIDDLKQFKTKVKVLRLYSHGEPLLNNNFCDMVRYAKESGKVETVDTTTNGILLNPILNLEIIDSGINRINISINGVNASQYKKFTKRKINFQKLVDNITHLYSNKKQCYLFIKINGDTISKEDEKLFLDIFEPIADSVSIERAFNCWENFEAEGFIKSDPSLGIYGQEIQKEVLVCPYSQYQLSIHSDGKVSQCFLDWNRKMIIGDISKEFLYDVWNGKKFKNFQNMMLNGYRKNHFYCKDCNQLIGGQPEDIDEYAQEIFKKREIDV